MPKTLTRVINDWLGCSRSCACGRTHRVTTRVVRFDDHAGSAVAEFLRSRAGVTSVLVVSDANTHAAAKAIASTLRAAGFDVGEYEFGAGRESKLIADDVAAGELDRAVRVARPECLVGVGSGTINDLCKTSAAAHRLCCISCPTAASMNGYTSPVASLKRGGLKVTDPVTAPEAVLVDLDVIRDAPPLMTAAGVADLLSKCVTAADWTLAGIVEGDYHCDVPAAMAARSADAVIENLDAIAERTEHGLHVLSAALVLSGLSMAVAGSSAPASGAEHLVSHYWDMCVPDVGGVRLHGTQVGVGTIITATLYEILREIDPAMIRPIDAADKVPPWDTLEADLHTHFAVAAPAVIGQARRKHRDRDAALQHAAFIKERWADIWSAVDPVLKPTAEIREWLRRAGAATTLSELGLAPTDAIDALRWSRHIRARYTVFDFATDIGFFDADRRLQLLQRSRVMDTREATRQLPP